jgi:hypothetical protein
MEMMTDDITVDQTIVPESEWRNTMESHENELAKLLDPYLKKRSMQQKDPVLDFLFEYYAFRPSHLKRWTPGIGMALEISSTSNLPEVSELTVSDQIAFLDPKHFPEKRIKSIRWTLDLLKKSANKKPLFGCFGMHEWAMVYRAGEVRHDQIPFRLSEEEIAEFVESRPLLCTHFDAFRFFTEKAKPMNRNELSRNNFHDMEQPGCLHTNMDLYKWAFKLYPWISSEVIREAFFNAVETRKVDMQASPYDAREFGLEPIMIETEEGRKMYLNKQTEIFERSMPIRQELSLAIEGILKRVI